LLSPFLQIVFLFSAAACPPDLGASCRPNSLICSLFFPRLPFRRISPGPSATPSVNCLFPPMAFLLRLPHHTSSPGLWSIHEIFELTPILFLGAPHCEARPTSLVVGLPPPTLFDVVPINTHPSLLPESRLGDCCLTLFSPSCCGGAENMGSLPIPHLHRSSPPDMAGRASPPS